MTGRTDHLLTGGENTRLDGGKPGTAAVSGLYSVVKSLPAASERL